MNHYATRMYFEQGGRHLWMAKELKDQGYEPAIFCADKVHNAQDQVVLSKDYQIEESKDIPFIFFKTRPYADNGLARIGNMFDFYRGLRKHYREIGRTIQKPDVILASSVHPLTLIAGLHIGKKLKVPCLCEVRDLWPESIVAYGKLKKNSLLAKVLYAGEKWIYKKADGVIMTFQGGARYIADKGWDREIPLEKVHYINNGVLLQEFDANAEKYQWVDQELTDTPFPIIYTGSIRPVNDIGMLLDTARILKDSGYDQIRFFIYGDGTEREALEQKVLKERLSNVVLKGSVEKKYIPSILKQGWINILHNKSTILNKYGQSQNKYFEYMAAGRYILQTYTAGFSELEKEQCGTLVSSQTPEEIAKAIRQICQMDQEAYQKACEKTRKLAESYDFRLLTKKLITIVEEL